jgi:FkbM family methyltransferase
MNVVFRNIPLTRIKIFGAKILLFFTSLVVDTKKKHIITRNNIHFEVDLTEGIDLSLYLFNDFQSHVYQNKFVQLKEDDVIFDVGANVGIMSLNFSSKAKNGKVYAFEPTHYALKKLYRNIELNPELAKVITVTNCFISAKSDANPEIVAFSSWKLNSRTDQDHEFHLGTPMSAEGVPSITMDDFVEKNNITRLDFIKVDTDGHEYEVFSGACNTIAALRPKIIFELGLYVMKEKNFDFDFYWNYFHPLNYKLYDSSNSEEITLENYNSHLPKYGSIDVLAIPQ